MLKSVQENRDSRLDLAGDSRLQATRRCTRARHARSWSVILTGALQDKIRQLVVLLSRDSVKPRASPVLKNLTLHIPFSPQYKYPLYPRKKESFQREFWERNPSVIQDWFIHNFHIRDFSNSSTLFLSIVNPLEDFYQNMFSPYPLLWEGCLVFWEAVRKEPIYIGWCYGQVAESRKLEKK